MIDLGDVVSLRVEIRDADDVLADPTDITVTITLPDGTTATPTPSNPAVGVYTIDYATAQGGRHQVRWVATGNNASAHVDVFDVRLGDIAAMFSVADGKKQLNIDADNTAHDDELRMFVEAMTAIIEGYVGAVIRRTVTEKQSGAGSDVVLTQTPVISVTSVVEEGTTLDADLYSLSTYSGVLTRVSGYQRYRWKRGVNNITVTYVAGRTVIPANFMQAAKLILQHMWETQRAGVGASKFGGSDGTLNYGGVDDVIIQTGFGYAIPRRAVEYLERDMDPGGVA